MKTGIELIAQERQEQKDKHGYTDAYEAAHPEYYSDGQLTDAAHFALTLQGWPKGWHSDNAKKIARKNYKDRLIVAGALIAAEIDRLNRLEDNSNPIRQIDEMELSEG